MLVIDYSIVISAVSVIVVGWTAIETLRMRRVAVEQNELQLLSFLLRLEDNVSRFVSGS